MSDDQAARRADPAAGDPEDHPLTGLLRSDAVVLMLARKAIDDYGGGPVGDLAARRVVDGEVRAMIAWPVGADYLRAADDYDRAGRAETPHCCGGSPRPILRSRLRGPGGTSATTTDHRPSPRS